MTAQQDIHARHHLVGSERPGQIIIAASTQAADAAVDIAQCAEHQYRRCNALRAQLRRHTEPVHAPQHQVQGDRVLTRIGCAQQAFATVGHTVSIDAVRRELGHELACGDVVVFDDQNAWH